MRRFIQSTRGGLVVALLSAFIVTGCGDDDDDDGGGDGNGDGAGQEDAGLDAGTGDGGAQEAGVDAGLVQSDGEIAAVVNAANAGEIAQGQLAVQEAQREEVQDYAQAMVDEHTAAQTRVTDLLTAEGITPTPNPVSQALQTASQDILTDLQAASPAEFDLLYMQAQQQVHAEVLELLDEQLIPAAENEALRSELETLRGSVEEHLENAENLLDELAFDAGVGEGGVGDAGADGDAGAEDAGVDSGT